MNTENKEYESLSVLMQSSLEERFRPVAYFDKHLDCIRVQLKDCSFTEHRLNQYWTELRENHGSNSFVGCNIKGIRYLFKKLGLQTSGVIKLTALIDGIVKMYPDASAITIKKSLAPILREEDLEVCFN